MSEFWQYFAVRPADVAAAQAKLAANGVDAVLDPTSDERWLLVVCDDPRVADLFDLVVRVEDHEESAWHIAVYRDGRQIGRGTFGTNPETGAHDQGFEGDGRAVATALGVGLRSLRKTWTEDGLAAFAGLAGIPLLSVCWDPAVGSGVVLLAELAGRLTEAEAEEQPVAAPAVASPDAALRRRPSSDLEGPIEWPTCQLLDRPAWHDVCEILSVRFHPDGVRMVTASHPDGSLKLWDLGSGRIDAQLRGSYLPRSAAVSPDGRQILSGSRNGWLRLWHTTTGTLLRTIKAHDSSQDLWQVAFVDDGRRVLSCSDDHTVRLSDTDSGSAVWSIKAAAGLVGFALGPGDRQVLCLPEWVLPADEEWRDPDDLKHPFVADVASGEVVRILDHVPACDYLAVALAPDGRTAALATRKRKVLLWDIEIDECVRVLNAHRSVVWSVVFTSDGRQLLTTGKDGTAKLWHLDTGKVAKTFQCGAAVFDATLSSDGRRLATASEDGVVRLWDLASGARLAPAVSVEEPVNELTRVTSLAWAPDSTVVMSTHSDGTIRHWAMPDGALVSTLREHAAEPISVAISPDGTRAAAMDVAGELVVWEPASGVVTQREQLSGSPLNEVAFSASGLLCVLADRLEVRTHDGTRVARVVPLVGREDMAGHSEGTACSDDGRTFVFPRETPDGLRQAVLDVENGTLLTDLPSGTFEGAVVLSNDRVARMRRLPIDGMRSVLETFDRTTGRLLEQRPAPPGHHKLMAIDAAGRFAIMNRYYGDLYVWDLHTDRVVSHWRGGHTGEVEIVRISPNARWAVTAGWGYAVSVWAMPDQEGRPATDSGERFEFSS